MPHGTRAAVEVFDEGRPNDEPQGWLGAERIENDRVEINAKWSLAGPAAFDLRALRAKKERPPALHIASKRAASRGRSSVRTNRIIAEYRMN